ncbi:MAG: glycosyltransferase family 2 protein [Prevotella sp.]|nr:glycosyltransferase family 2 protein [Bacteroides sp.]MCM1366461.1 glycosyltransferase family 2 protein [Prevotella sp.]MCM1437059.1 glycosyltransferase family 2 protein [Prevotella sp.]
MKDAKIILQVFICTYGRERLDRMAKQLHEPHPGVEYVICRQLGEGDSETDTWPEIEAREDYRIITSNTVGIAANRNLAIENATAPVALISDDDISILPGGLDTLMEDFERHPEAAVMSFKFVSDTIQKKYPSFEFNLKKIPRFYYVSAMEIAVRPEKIRGKVKFNEAFGFRTHFHGGEEDVFLIDVLKSGLDWVFVPHEILFHEGPSTGTRPDPEYHLIETKGAVTGHRHHFTWPLRMIWRGWNETGKNKKYRFFPYIRHWLKGWYKAKRLGVFN